MDDERAALLEWEKAGEKKYLAQNPVYQSINYRRFVSYSKGRRNGKRRMRKHWKEVRLVGTKKGISHGRISGGGYRQWHRFPFDIYAGEIWGSMVKPDEAEEMLKQEIIRIWGY